MPDQTIACRILDLVEPRPQHIPSRQDQRTINGLLTNAVNEGRGSKAILEVIQVALFLAEHRGARTAAEHLLDLADHIVLQHDLGGVRAKLQRNAETSRRQKQTRFQRFSGVERTPLQPSDKKPKGTIFAKDLIRPTIFR